MRSATRPMRKKKRKEINEEEFFGFAKKYLSEA
jgi:hypothetical protein